MVIFVRSGGRVGFSRRLSHRKSRAKRMKESFCASNEKRKSDFLAIVPRWQDNGFAFITRDNGITIHN